MTHRQIKAVLLALKSHSCFSDIHIDPRTILKTPIYSLPPISSLAGGEYLHLGTEGAIKKILQSAPVLMIPDVLQLDFSMDEASLDKAGLLSDNDSSQHPNVYPSMGNAQDERCFVRNDDNDNDDDNDDEDPGRHDSDSMSCSTTASFQRKKSLPDFEDRLAAVFTEQNMTHRQIKAVLLALKSHSCFSDIHIDPRTILKTPIYSLPPISSLAGGEYLHLGTEGAIKKILQSAPVLMIPDVLQLDFSMDEASLDKAEMVGIFRSSKKPTSVVEFFHFFVTDMRFLLQDGVQFGDKNRCIKLRCFVADALARALVLCHRSHNSRSPCSRCCVQGESVRSGVMVYKGTKHHLRKEDEYRSRINHDHHKMVEQTPLADHPFDIVSNTVFDYMHLVCLGIMEKILQGVIDGRFVKSVKLSANHIKLVTDRLEQVSKFCPRDFARKPVNIDKHGKFKATEHRQILLYSGVNVFNGLVNSAVYKHFVLLHVAIRILADSHHTPRAIDFAQEYIETFVELASDVYVEFLSFITHSLLHLSDDARSFGHLDSFSAFPYENNMTFCRKLCRKPNQHLQHISNRIHESCRTASKPYVDPNHLKFVRNHVNGPTPSSAIVNNNDENGRHDSDSMSCSTTASFQRKKSLPDFEDRLAAVFTEQNMTHRQIKAVLLALKSHSCFSDIHIDPRTILKTPVYSLSPISSLAGGEYLHLDTEGAIKKILQSAPVLMIPDVLQLDFSTDEASLDKAGNILMWPIQIRIANIPPSSPEMVDVSLRTHSLKLSSCVIEATILEVLVQGVACKANPFVLVLWFTREPNTICARMMNTGQELIMTITRWLSRLLLQIFLLTFDIVSNTIFDYMHLVCLGIMEKILQGVIDGVNVFNGLVNSAVYKHFVLLHVAIRILADPHHTPQAIDFAQECIETFVELASDVYGVEFLSFNTHSLLHLSDDARSFGHLDSFSAFPYENNMTFCRKLCRKPNQHLQHISNRIHESCRTASKPYVDPNHLKFVRNHVNGPTPSSAIVNNNDENDDARSFGHLDSFSAFPYENNMTFCRKLCRKPNQHLQQISNRIHESCRTASKPYVDLNNLKFVTNHVNDLTPSSVIVNNNDENGKQYQKVITGDIHLSTSQQDSTVMLKNGSIGVIKNIIDYERKGCHLLLRVFSKVEDLFKLSCDSSLVAYFFFSSCVSFFTSKLQHQRKPLPQKKPQQQQQQPLQRKTLHPQQPPAHRNTQQKELVPPAPRAQRNDVLNESPRETLDSINRRLAALEGTQRGIGETLKQFKDVTSMADKKRKNLGALPTNIAATKLTKKMSSFSGSTGSFGRSAFLTETSTLSQPLLKEQQRQQVPPHTKSLQEPPSHRRPLQQAAITQRKPLQQQQPKLQQQPSQQHQRKPL
ncbi:hypothetical protein TSAR_009001 [Trichomalopsis sarcophagae]|uniref:Uncharacterized protein n=1 Tax=Trichomalopsis sarcophagae TaxID=543379 RepID=A0A232EFE6_9HYME|nr:hypothetical protein TSAR_009001 [Trichomalopsis sarcophagae]